MADEFGNLISEAAPYAPAAMQAYQAYNRNKNFYQGAFNASQGAWLGADIARMSAGRGAIAAAGRTAAGRAVTGTAARVLGGAAARTAGTAAVSGAVAGAEAGSVVPGVGTAIGAVAGAVAPLILPHIPVVGAAVNKVPLIGGILSPKKQKEKPTRRPLGQFPESPHLQPLTETNVQTPSQYAMENRAEYEAGRGFRRK